MVTERSNMLLFLYGHYKNGILAYKGGILEQPAFYAKSMLIIERLAEERKK